MLERVKKNMRFTAVITEEGKWYIAHCVELGVVKPRKDY